MINELQPELLAMHALNPYAMFNSSSRSVMFGNHFAQRLVIEEPDDMYVQSGVCHDFAKYTFSTKIPCNARIIRVIDRYPQGIGQDALPFNPETLVIYEEAETGIIDYVSIEYFKSYHQFFGFKNKPVAENMAKVYPGAHIPANTILANSPSVSENGSFDFGLNLNVAMMSLPGVAEDGVIICEDVLPKMKFRIYERRTVGFGKETFPLNIHGHKDHYKGFPDIGDWMREDGLLMMLREYCPELGPVDMSALDVTEPQYNFDRATYVRGGDKKTGNIGRVVDIKVYGNTMQNKQLPEAMSAQINRYKNALVRFHQDILTSIDNLGIERKKKFGVNNVKTSRKLHRLLVESRAVVGAGKPGDGQKVGMFYRKEPLDEVRIEFVIEYIMQPGIGFKVTDIHGGNRSN